jgi:beta-lactamase regulating signal transducer with metallopeptidase domain
MGAMAEGFWVVFFIVVAIVVYVVAKTVYYARKSEQQWREVDKTKLKKWDDDDR